MSKLCWCLHPKDVHTKAGCHNCMITRLSLLQAAHRYRPLGEHFDKKKLFHLTRPM